MRVLVLDNYDSFTWNLVQAFRVLGAQVEVHLHDRITPGEILAREPDRLVLSPGPGRPEDAGITVAAVRACTGRIPILGVCLGHQCIAVAEGARILPASRLVHGKTSLIHHDGQGLFAGLPDPFPAARYHSLLVDPDSLPAHLVPSAWTSEGELMAFRRVDAPVVGIQFHPESFLTPQGSALLSSFLEITTEVYHR